MAAWRPRSDSPHGTTVNAYIRRSHLMLALVASYLATNIFTLHHFYKHDPIDGDDGIVQLMMESAMVAKTSKGSSAMAADGGKRDATEIEARRRQLRAVAQANITCRCVNCPDDKICGGLWKGDRYPGTPSNETAKQRRLHVVVSHCKKSLNWLKKYLIGYNVASIHVVNKCGVAMEGAPPELQSLPNIGRCDHTYAHYITTVLPQKIGANHEDDDSVVLFLKDDVSEKNLHQHDFRIVDLGSMISVASSSNGFACGIVPRSFSAYHDKEVLFEFEMSEYNSGVGAFKELYKKLDAGDVEFKSAFENLGAFFQSLDVAETTSDLVQVCYGGVFAASVRSIYRQDVKVWKRMEDLLARGNNIEEGHFAERSWAHLLAKPLEPFQVRAMRNVTTGLIMDEAGVLGALGDELCGGCWKGDRYSGMLLHKAVLRKKIHVMVSHCKSSLDWLKRYLEGFDVASIHIISICGVDVEGAPASAEVQSLPYVGPSDHAYAHYITTILPRKILSNGGKEDSIVAFLKDDISVVGANLLRSGLRVRNINVGDFRSMISVASSSNGFGCALVPLGTPIDSVSAYHDKEILFQFEMGVNKDESKSNGNKTDGTEFKSTHKNLLAFFESLNVTRKSPDLVQVCYGGVFAASVKSIHQQDAAVWRRMEDLLAGGGYFDDGHLFAERSWAHLLAKPLELRHVRAMRKYATGFLNRTEGMAGALHKTQKPVIDGLWKGGKYSGMPSLQSVQRKKIHVVVSYCKRPLNWLEKYLGGINIASIHIVSICGVDVEGAPTSAEVERIPNVGPSDHAYAHYITTILPRKIGRNDANEDGIVAFLKDDVSEEDLRRSGLRVKNVKVGDFKFMISIASSSNGFGCGLLPIDTPVDSVSAYYDKKVLFQFRAAANKDGSKSQGIKTDSAAEFESKHENLGAFLESLNVTRKTPDLVQVCYGGVFAASVKSIRRQDPAVWRRMEDLLSRGGDFAEGHLFAERSWAHLLAEPLEWYHVKAMREHATGFFKPPNGMAGALHKTHRYYIDLLAKKFNDTSKKN